MNAQLEGVLRLTLDMAQGRLVMTALAELPFKRVFELIGRLNQAANGGMNAMESGGFPCDVTATEWRTMIEALGKLPYEQVHGLIAALQQQAPRAADNDDLARRAGSSRIDSGSR
jgi:hypothetical protein